MLKIVTTIGSNAKLLSLDSILRGNTERPTGTKLPNNWKLRQLKQAALPGCHVWHGIIASMATFSQHSVIAFTFL